MAEPGKRVVIDKHYNNGAYRDQQSHTIAINMSNHFILDGFEVTDSHPDVLRIGERNFDPTSVEGENLMKSHLDSGVKITSSYNDTPPVSHITMQNLDVHHNGGVGLQTGANTHSNNFFNNKSHHNGRYGTYIQGPNFWIKGNEVYRNNGVGINLGNSVHEMSDSIVENNRVYDNGFYFYHPSSGKVSQGGHGIVNWGGTLHRNNIIRNNIVFNKRKCPH